MNPARRHIVHTLCLAMTLACAGATGFRAQAADARFDSFLQSLWPKAQQQGVGRAAFDAAIAGLTPDPALAGSGERQAEFERTLKAYLDDAASGSRIARGREARQKYRADLAAAERAYGVPAEIILAIWGMETEFGRNAGDKDVIRSLATLAFSRADGGRFADEVIAAMVMIERGIPRARLRGSWAGAMGNPQFLPSAYLKYAVSPGGARTPDIWTSVPDSLASIGNFIRTEGWKPGLAWGAEVVIPQNFDWRSLKGSAAQLAAKGVRSVDGRQLPPAAEATLFFPAGASGPAFLLTENYWIIKQYNNSDSYAMSVAYLGDRIAGRPAIKAAWPTDFRLLGREDRVRLQTLLRDQGFYSDRIDGRFGPASRDAIHRFQVNAGIFPADGFASAALLARLASGK